MASRIKMAPRLARIAFTLVSFACMGVRAGQGALEFHLPEMELCAAIVEFSRQSKLSVLFAPVEYDCSLRTQPVLGWLEPREALGRMLAGTALTIEEVDRGMLIIGGRRMADSTSVYPTAVRALEQGN